MDFGVKQNHDGACALGFVCIFAAILIGVGTLVAANHTSCDCPADARHPASNGPAGPAHVTSDHQMPSVG
jgi:hypothetical protein